MVSLFPLPQYVVVLEDVEKTRLVPIWIGVNEGNAIALEIQGERFPRPLTHDLAVNLVKELGGEIEKVVVSDLKENSYYALIYIKHNGRVLTLDARPSDALALAVRVHCPIYIDEKVLNKCPQIDRPISQEEIEQFKEDLKKMSPEDFFKSLEAVPPDEAPSSGADPGEEDDEADEEGDDQEEDEER
ncbi:MAG: hypothetical protein AUJ71_04365 [Candidatus Omnitrophica bacterium CG1_02_49_16]|nr:MAG: hypothetical protein AUJ71_04365 [Candidatus Omnitrophica bacterium CG1_02_49_16]